MTLRMLDSVTVANLPAGADAYAGYVDGNFQTFGHLKALFPQARLLSIAVFASENAECLDIENGDATPAQAPIWARRQLARGVRRPVLYAGAATMPAVLVAIQAAGIKRSQVRLWSAHYGSGKHVCGPSTCAQRDGQDRVVPACDGTQWNNRAAGAGGSLIDESLLADDFFSDPSQPSQPVKKYHPEEPMLLNKGAKAKTPLTFAKAITQVRFFASEPATIGVDVRDGKGERTIKLDYPSAQTVDIPDGTNAIVVHRVDAGDNDVSAAFDIG